MVQCSTAVKQMSLQMLFLKYCQTSSVDDIIRESIPHGRRHDGESATADDPIVSEGRSASSHCLSAANEQEHVE